MLYSNQDLGLFLWSASGLTTPQDTTYPLDKMVELTQKMFLFRGLCVDALIVMSDGDADWELDLEEFRRCLDPEFEPPPKRNFF